MKERKQTMTESDDEIKIKAWLAIRKEAALKIDPETAEVIWDFRDECDPYGILPEEDQCGTVGRHYFARSPDSDIWVWCGDIPDATWDALWEKHTAKLAFPAGLPPINDDETINHDETALYHDAEGGVVVRIDESTKQEAAKLAQAMAKHAQQIGLLTYREEHDERSNET
jgi:hypothetical protein